MWPPYGHPHKSSATVVTCIIKMAIMRLIHVHLVEHFFFCKYTKANFLAYFLCAAFYSVCIVLQLSRSWTFLSAHHYSALPTYFLLLTPYKCQWDLTYSKIVQIPLKGSWKKMIILLPISLCRHFWPGLLNDFLALLHIWRC